MKFFNEISLKRASILISILIIVCTLSIIIIANVSVERSTENLVYSDINKLPYNKVGLVLGTSKTLKRGKPNEYYQNRIKAVTELFKAHKIDYIVISGDNGRSNYNEPLDMENDLIQLGIDKERIYLDYAGFRTYDSIIRMEKIFGQRCFTIITQDFQNRRALYIARHEDLQAIGYDAEDVTKYNGFKVKLREKFARVKLFIDLLINKKPKFLGSPIEIK